MFLQLNVRVSDKADRPLISQQTATVTITVERNLFAPVFQNLPTTRSLPRTAGFGFNVFTVIANDSDVRVLFMFGFSWTFFCMKHLNLKKNSKYILIYSEIGEKK